MPTTGLPCETQSRRSLHLCRLEGPSPHADEQHVRVCNRLDPRQVGTIGLAAENQVDAKILAEFLGGEFGQRAIGVVLRLGDQNGQRSAAGPPKSETRGPPGNRCWQSSGTSAFRCARRPGRFPVKWLTNGAERELYIVSVMSRMSTTWKPWSTNWRIENGRPRTHMLVWTPITITLSMPRSRIR